MKPALLLLACLLAALLLGCGAGALDPAIASVNGSHDALVQSHDALEAIHKQARDKALDGATSEADARAQTDAVQKRFKGAWDAYDAARADWLATRAAIASVQAAQAAGKAPDLPRIATLLATMASAWDAFQAAVEATRAAR